MSELRRCYENPHRGYYLCGNGVTVDGVRYCSEYGIKVQIAYAGHTFCAALNKHKGRK